MNSEQIKITYMVLDRTTGRREKVRHRSRQLPGILLRHNLKYSMRKSDETPDIFVVNVLFFAPNC